MYIRSYRTSQNIIRAGEVPTHFQLIVRGMVRYFYSSYEGKERNKAFFREGSLIGSLSALYAQGPCPFSIETLEPCRLGVTPLDAFLELGSRYATVQLLLHRLTVELFIRNELREAVLLTGDMEARYRWVQEQEAWLLERVPQYHIASYLGMDAVSLSRLKRNKH